MPTTTTSICKRCHRLRPVNEARYCFKCYGELREAEKHQHPKKELPATAKPEPLPPLDESTVTTTPAAPVEHPDLYPGLDAS
jgi:hypothetical protein